MKRIIRAGFVRRIVLPAMLAIVLFLISVFVFVIPAFENSAVEQKKKMLHELTNTAWSILDKYSSDASAGILALADAQVQAVAEIEALRYGAEDKDYFWITDLTPVMIMHPYVQELTGQSLQDFEDPDGKKLFIEAADIARTAGEGFISYKWQLRDDTTRIVPKLSFVKRFVPWDWVIGTGIYMDDVQDEISALTRKLLLVMLGITVIIALIIAFITFQSLEIENQRREAEERLRESREKYRSLLESSTEGIILLLNSQIAYANAYIQALLNFAGDELSAMNIADIIPGVSPAELESVTSEKRLETTLSGRNGQRTEALLSILPVRFADKEGLLLTFRDISEHRSLKTELAELREQLLNMSGQPPGDMNRFGSWVAALATTGNTTAGDLALEPLTCPAETPVSSVAAIMNRSGSRPIVLTTNQMPIGIITADDIVRRVVATAGDPARPAAMFMSSPLVMAEPWIPVSEAAALMQQKGVSHLLLRNSAGNLTGITGLKEIADLCIKSAGIGGAGLTRDAGIEELTRYRKNLPWLIRPLLNELGDAGTFTKILSQTNDEITRRIIDQSVEEAGPPPAPFVFFVYGSAGRDELTFNSDQDNALIYSDDSTLGPAETHSWFLQLSSRICQALNDTGLTRCRGGYMASNPQWCRPLSVWKGYFSEWILNAEPENILKFSVFFDLRRVYGDNAIFTELEDFIFDALRDRTAFFYLLAQSAVTVKFPQITTVAGSDEHGKRKEEVIDIKALAAPLVMFTRIYALNRGIRAKNTGVRINALRMSGGLGRQTSDELASFYNFLLYQRLSSQLDQIVAREEISSEVPLSRMNETGQTTIRKLLNRAGSLTEILTAEFMSAYRG